jgi:hypothetical protein
MGQSTGLYTISETVDAVLLHPLPTDININRSTKYLYPVLTGTTVAIQWGEGSTQRKQGLLYFTVNVAV